MELALPVAIVLSLFYFNLCKQCHLFSLLPQVIHRGLSQVSPSRWKVSETFTTSHINNGLAIEPLAPHPESSSPRASKASIQNRTGIPHLQLMVIRI